MTYIRNKFGLKAWLDTLNKIAKIIEERKGSEPSASYVALLLSKGLNKILEKVGEEAIETILAARDIEKDDDKVKWYVKPQRSLVSYTSDAFSAGS